MRIGRFGEFGGSYVAKPLKKCLTITGHPLFKSEFLGVLYFFDPPPTDDGLYFFLKTRPC